MSIDLLPIELIHHIGKYLPMKIAIRIFYPSIKRGNELIKFLSIPEKYELVQYYIIRNDKKKLKKYLKKENLNLYISNFKLLGIVCDSFQNDDTILKMFLKTMFRLMSASLHLRY